MARFDRYNVTIQGMQVHDVSDGFGGGDLEAELTFIVNGQAQTYRNDDLGEGNHSLGLTFIVEVPTDANEIILSVSGTEDDTFSPDPLPAFTLVFGQIDDWGLGAHQHYASNGSIAYTLYYQIYGIVPVFEVLPREVLIAVSSLRAAAKKIDRPLSEETLLAASFTWLNRQGWQLVGTQGQDYVFKGAGGLPQKMLQRVTAP